MIKFHVLDIALKKAEARAQKAMRFADIVIIEFARDDYGKALKQFDPSFLRDAFFIFIDTDVARCMQRIQHRVTHQKFPDDYFVSEEILRDYYHRQVPSAELRSKLTSEYGVEKQRMIIINNKGTERKFERDIIYAFSAIINAKTNNRLKFVIQLVTSKVSQGIRKVFGMENPSAISKDVESADSGVSAVIQ